MTATVVLTGGAGYIGRCAALLLKDSGYHPVLFDNFSSSSKKEAEGFDYREVELADAGATQKAFDSVKTVDAVIHFAAKALVSESVEKPGEYFRNNVLATVNCAESAVRKKVPVFVHSSSCAVYGTPDKLPITESSKMAPISPYGETKLLNERILAHYRTIYGLKILNLRYFNPAGSFKHVSGERHSPETHLVPNLVKAIATGSPFLMYGHDYPTPDGSCLRDLIHIEDLVEAHLAALVYLQGASANYPDVINLGSGKEISVLAAVQAAEKALGKKAIVKTMPRRPGDPPRLLADIGLAKSTLNWAPKRGLDAILRDHYEWWKKEGNRE